MAFDTVPTADATRDALVARHLDLARRIALQVFGRGGRRAWLDDGREAADAALIRAADQYDPDRGEFGPFASVVIRTALRRLLAHRCRQSARNPRVDPLDPDTAAPEPTPVGFPIDVADTLAGLTPGQRETIELHVVWGLSFAEIGRRRGVSGSAARLQFHRAATRLRKILGPPGTV